jgi:predicted DNA-binding transcriptional regulator YafY
MAAAQYTGITIDDVTRRFGCAKRTAQRMLRMLEARFIDTEVHFDHEGRKRWKLRQAAIRDLMSLLPDELAALDLAVASLARSSQDVEAAHLRKLREKILALVPRGKAARLETDHEALLEAQGLATRPGPRPKSDPIVMAAIAHALKACLFLDITYQGRNETGARRRRIAPLGMLLGLRRYVVARAAEDMKGRIRLFRTDAIQSAKVSKAPFERDMGFSLQEFAKRAFGTFQNDDEFGEIVWRFAPNAVQNAREFEFHPNQRFEEQPDGSLIVRFEAAGHLEMCWHLYAWGDKVEVLKPDSLKSMIGKFRRSDFPALP